MKIKYLILDIDGTLTDGGVYYDETGNEIKKFCTKDGTGIILAIAAGITPVVLTGRECAATSRRMKELGVNSLYQGVRNKVEWIGNWMNENGISKEQVGYIGDDINDYSSMKLCGFVACPADSEEDIMEISDYVSKVSGGYGVVRDVVRYILKKENLWEEIIKKAYGAGI